MKQMIKVLTLIVLAFSAAILHIVFMINTREGFSVGSEWIIYAIILFAVLSKVCGLYEKGKNKAKS